MKSALVPIRDTHRDGAPVVFCLQFYGLDRRDLSFIQYAGKPDPDIGSAPIRRALERRGFDTDRYQPFLWDLL